jgi:polysaccharide deacetylase family protein (PEP-CTERM system associated)
VGTQNPPNGAPPPHVAPEPPFALSVDVEDYFQVQAFVRYVPRSTWDGWPSRVERNTRRLLDLFEETNARATFFTLGWIARRHPALVREIVARGHEIASHGMNHDMLTTHTPETFRRDATDSRALLEDIASARVIGFRAPSYSVNRSTLWALDVLAEAGYEYDSSIYPIARRRYGYPGGPTQPGTLRASRNELTEFPLPTIPLGPVRVPVLAGAYLRLWPSWFSLRAARLHHDRGAALVLNVHPWEIDVEQPTIGSARWRTWTHYARLGRTEGILRLLLSRAIYRDVASRLREMGLIPELRNRGRGIGR